MPLRRTTIATGAVEGVPGGLPTITVFRGIPYAAPTSGANRFRPPQPAAPWTGVRRCDAFPAICWQDRVPEAVPFGRFFRKEFYPVDYERSEDSLALNVWTPAQNQGERLPVMVWIHGGGYGSGYGHEMEFDGEALAKRGVVLVTIQYRLGCFGFFAHPVLSRTNPSGTSGNNGILDQVAALRWVRDNIAAFGGDPGNVTIFGQSAGGGSVLSHLASPLSEGLFQRAIVQSGTFLIQTTEFGHTLEKAEAWGFAALASMGRTLDEALAMPAAELLSAFGAAERAVGPAPKLNLDGYVFDLPIASAVRRGRLKDVEILTGSVAGDAGLGMRVMDRAGDPAAASLRFRFGPDGAARFLAEHPLEKDGAAIVAALDASASHGDALLADAQARNGKKPAYAYFFDATMPGANESGFVPEGHAYHSAELWFVFGTLDRCWRRFDGRHHDLAAAMQDYWTNFARSGDPNGPGLPAWPAYDPASPRMLAFNEKGVGTIPATTKEIDAYLAFARKQD